MEIERFEPGDIVELRPEVASDPYHHYFSLAGENRALKETIYEAYKRQGNQFEIVAYVDDEWETGGRYRVKGLDGYVIQAVAFQRRKPFADVTDTDVASLLFAK